MPPFRADDLWPSRRSNATPFSLENSNDSFCARGCFRFWIKSLCYGRLALHCREKFFKLPKLSFEKGERDIFVVDYMLLGRTRRRPLSGVISNLRRQMYWIYVKPSRRGKRVRKRLPRANSIKGNLYLTSPRIVRCYDILDKKKFIFSLVGSKFSRSERVSLKISSLVKLYDRKRKKKRYLFEEFLIRINFSRFHSKSNYFYYCS